MKPTEKELKCILYAQQYYPPRKKTLWEKLFRLSRGESNNYEVSPVKTFLQLWSDYGLRDYGIDYFIRGRFPEKHKRDCIRRWVCILYPFNIDIAEIENELLREIQMMVKEFYEKNPGDYLTPANPIDLVPEEIDKRYNSYDPL